jgi:hypothetical protein
MLFEILRALGLDVPARINALKADLDQRVEQTTSHVSQAAQHAAVLAVFFTLAAIAVLLAFVVALVAIFWVVAINYGVLAGLAVDFILLVLAAAILATLARGRSKSVAVNVAQAPRALLGATTAPSAAGVAGPVPNLVPPAAAFVSPTAAAAPEAANPTARDVVQPLAALLTKAGSGRPMVAELLGSVSGTGANPVNTALDRAANVVRTGDRANLLTVLAGAAVVGWLLTRQSGRK